MVNQGRERSCQRVVDELRRYVQLQAHLIGALKEQSGSSTLEMMFRDIPATGHVQVSGETWDYTRHGSGVLFRAQGHGRAVDVHERCDDTGYFDSWRLRTYFGSLRTAGTRLVESAVGSSGGPLRDAVDLMLAQLLDSGAVLADEGGFRLCE